MTHNVLSNHAPYKDIILCTKCMEKKTEKSKNKIYAGSRERWSACPMVRVQAAIWLCLRGLAFPSLCVSPATSEEMRVGPEKRYTAKDRHEISILCLMGENVVLSIVPTADLMIDA